MVHRGRHISYCTNVHPGEGLDAVEGVLNGPVAAVKAQVADGQPFGLGLRLGAEAVGALSSSPAAERRLLDVLRAEALYVFTLNGFPYGDFAAPTVKAAVYSPDWRDPARREYTLELARILARMPGPAARTISTVAGGFGPDTTSKEAHQLIGENLRWCAQRLAELADETGVHVRLCLEPEPWTTLETTGDAVEFFDAQLSAPVAREHLGVCYDTCHQAVHFESAPEAIGRLVDAGITIGKVQISSALHLSNPRDPAARRALLDYAEPRYLHQVVAQQADGRLLKALDLPELARPAAAWLEAEAWRCHFHVPIFWRGEGALRSTRSDWEQAVASIVARVPEAHFEIETYTWDVLPEARRDGGVVACVVREFEALTGVLDGVLDGATV